MHLVGFIIKKFVTMHGHMNVKKSSETLVPTYESAWYNDLEAGTIKARAIYANAWAPTVREGTKMLFAFHIFC